LVTPREESHSLYFHIPFCTKKCPYCHFYVIPNKPDLRQTYLGALEREWNLRLPLLEGKKIVSVYFGGGTPTLLPKEDLRTILSWLKPLHLSPDCEITIEGNPEELNLPLLEALRALGINRLSLGVQSLDDSSLEVLGRTHSAKRAKEAILDAHLAGFENISIDLMYDLPWQTETTWQKTLEATRNLPISHLSLYNLTIEPHTAFFKKKELLQKVIPKDEESLRLLQMAIQDIEKAGLKRYEISAFAKEGCQSRHNTGYWIGRPFLGFGPSAFSYWEGKRFRNIAHLQRYSQMLLEGQIPVDFEEELSYPDNVHELLAIGLRLFEGVNKNRWKLPKETLDLLNRLEQEGFLEQQDDTIRLTARGTLFYDTVAEELI
jgi:oxygen-independent coproporphyrinogen-3 oxidase